MGQIVVPALILVAGFVMLVKGADWFVDGAASIAARFGISQLVIGLTIVAMGTSAPETAVSTAAALKGSGGIAVGNVLGSNTINILVILGLSALLSPLPVERSTIKREIPFTIAITALLAGLGWDGELSRLDGAILLACFALFLGYLFATARAGDEKRDDSSKPLPRVLAATAIGLALVVLGGNVTVDAATDIARYFGLSERIIGLTIIAFGTSLPELVTSVAAARKGSSSIAIGNIVGSCIFNILFVLGIASVISPVPFPHDFMLDTAFSGAAAVILLALSARRALLSRPEGAIMLAAYAGYFYLIA